MWASDAVLSKEDEAEESYNLWKFKDQNYSLEADSGIIIMQIFLF